MPGLVVAGTTVTVAANSVQETRVEIGDRHRAFDGTERQSIRNRVSEWRGTTVPLDRTTADGFRSTLQSSTQPQECYGDLIGASTVHCNTVFAGMRHVLTSTGTRFRVEFLLLESS